MSGGRHGKKAQREEALRWYAIAKEDLRVATLCSSADPPSPEAAAYHCQQAAEKLIEGLPVAAAEKFRNIHDLDELADQALGRYPTLSQSLDFCRPLTRRGTLFRYPTLGDEGELKPSAAEISEAVERLVALADAIRSQEPSELRARQPARSRRARRPARRRRGSGGQPRMWRSTGTTAETPPTTA